MGAEKDDARLVSRYVDSLVERQRGEEETPPGREADLDEVLDLARSIAAIDLKPAPGLGDQVWKQAVQTSAASGKATPQSWAEASRRWILRMRLSLTPAASKFSLVGGAVLLILWLIPPALSGADVLARADAALRSLIQPGEVLLRRTRTEVTLRQAGAPARRRVDLSEMWIDGSMPGRQIERITNEVGQLQSVTLTLPEAAGPGWRYHTPEFGGPYFEPRDLARLRNTLEIRPGAAAMREAIAGLTSSDRALVEWLRARTLPDGLARQRRLNRTLFEFSARHEPEAAFLPEVTGFGRIETARGEPLYRVETLTRRALWADPALGLADQQPGMLTGTRHISQSTYLTARYDRSIRRDNGDIIRLVSETIEVRSVPRGSLDDPFVFEPPTTARRVEISAEVEARRLAAAIRSLGLQLPPR